MGNDRPKSSDKQAQPARRQGRLHGLLSTLFSRDGRDERPDRKPAVASAKEGAADEGPSVKIAEEVRDRGAMDADLSAVLKAVPGSRETFRHLVAVLHGLRNKDNKGLFLFTVEASHVRTALRQLDGLTPKDPSPGLVALRARMVDAIDAHENRAKRLERPAPRSDLMQSDHMEVREASTTEFDRALQR